jgi:hypothetical protein
LTFKNGRFIEVDNATNHFKRCDLARVNVVTKESKTIDTTMVVKVLGKRFEIQIVEEFGDGLLLGDGGTKVGIGWQDYQTSRTSFGGDSNYAAVVGCGSEIGTNADVSDSCQVLLEIPVHEGDKTVTFDANRNFGYSEEEMSGTFSNFLGKVLEPVVNHERDKREVGCLLDGMKTEKMLVVEPSFCRNGAQ